ncbi:MAG: SDR family oxidoreductase [Anaerolineae bacterium]|nr:SDR family oxidoreductase [Anaerolineae bacterium]
MAPDLSGKAAVVIGGSGVLCGALARGLARQGAAVVVVGHSRPDRAQRVVDQILDAGGRAMAAQADVLDRRSLEGLAQQTLDALGRIDVLINGAGGAKPEATTSAALPFFDLPKEAVQWVFDLNFLGTFLACQVFGRHMVDAGAGHIVNISSMGAERPLTRSVAYSAAKAATSNFTQWLAVHMAHNYSTQIRVNAIAPGFFLTEQNRFLLTDPATGELTPRGRSIITHTPLGRFGDPEDLVGTLLWLLSDEASFVHGIVVPVDGGFSAYSGV